MSAGMDALKQIQALDKEIFIQQKRKKERPAALAKEVGEVAKRREAYEVKARELKALRAEVESREKQEIGEKDERLSKLNLQLNQAKSNKEYAALTTEINSTKADKGKIEEQILVSMNKIEALTREVDELKKSWDECEQSLEGSRRQVEADLAAIDAALSGLGSKRAALAAKVETDLLKLYNRIQKNKVDGVGIAVVVDGFCQGCNMDLTAQDQNMLARGKDTMLCRSCGRIMYLEPA